MCKAEHVHTIIDKGMPQCQSQQTDVLLSSVIENSFRYHIVWLTDTILFG